MLVTFLQKKIATLAFSMLFMASVSAAPLAAYLAENKKLTQKDFLQTFDFAMYVKTLDLADTIRLETDRQFLLKHKRSDVDFFQKIAATYLLKHPFNLTDLKANIPVLQKIIVLAPIKKTAYLVLSDELLNGYHQVFQNAINNKELDADCEDAKQLIRLFEQEKYLTSIPVNQSTKVIKHIKAGDWAYLYRRFCEFFLEHKIYAVAVFFLTLGGIYLIFKIFKQTIYYFRNEKNK
ncbi:MAG: hypothetical protein RI894_1721 [Bacteroidota bacterium]|jgi:hypothetical protein